MEHGGGGAGAEGRAEGLQVVHAGRRRQRRQVDDGGDFPGRLEAAEVAQERPEGVVHGAGRLEPQHHGGTAVQVAAGQGRPASQRHEDVQEVGVLLSASGAPSRALSVENLMNFHEMS